MRCIFVNSYLRCPTKLYGVCGEQEVLLYIHYVSLGGEVMKVSRLKQARFFIIEKDYKKSSLLDKNPEKKGEKKVKKKLKREDSVKVLR